MPHRWCACTGCPACTPQGRTHGVLYDADLTGTLRCPPCQQQATAKRNARPNTSSRGYGSSHQRIRDDLLKIWRQGDPCALCGRPMMSKRALDLAHNEDRSGYKGLAHQRCNRNTAGKPGGR